MTGAEVGGRTTVDFGGFVHADRGSLMDGRGRPILLRGVGLGNWLLPEGYMWRFPREGPQSPRQIEALITDLVGGDAAAAFWRGFREHFISETDIERIAAEGFDHVRLPMNSRLLIDEAGELRVDGLAPIDRLIEWCRRHRLWVILDLHGAPGGQTGTNIDDSPRGQPDLFVVGGAYRDLTIALWTRLAARYRDETVIAGYDLLNEPLPHEHADRYAADLVSLYRDLTAAIRSVDRNHLITYEGVRWSTDWSIFSEVWDHNSMLQFHKYWSAPDRPSIAGYLRSGQALGLPIYMGEGGENDAGWLQTAFGLYEDLGISWNFWPWKKLDTWTSPLSVRPPEGWPAVVRYASGQGPKPAAASVERWLEELLERMRPDVCEYRTEIISALFHRVPVRLAPEAFGFLGEGVSYRTHQARPLAWFRSDDRVTIRRAGGAAGEAGFDHSDGPGQDGPGFDVEIGAGEWLEYSIEVAMPSRLDLEVDAQLADPGRGEAPFVSVDDDLVSVQIVDGSLQGTTSGGIVPGRHVLRIAAGGSVMTISSIRITPAVNDADSKDR
jgi:endoglucanase